ncbi:MAG: amidohydrolase family protein, partial [Pseudomonadota bacterium]
SAFNDHTSMSMRAFDVPVQDRVFEQSPAYPLADLDDPRLKTRWASSAVRAAMEIDAYLARARTVWGRREDVGAAIARVAAAGRAAGAPMLSHDDTQVETRAYYRALGATIAEFPMVMAPTQDARDAGDFIVFGAPNAVRGGSHIGSLGAGDMVEAGLCDALASDYFYPAMLAAIARLDQERRAPRHALWSLVSAGPAAASGLTDRGVIAPGKRADLVLVDWPDGGVPAVRLTLVAGRTAYWAEPAG